ncbi:MAG: M48 family metalloprotease [Candidatus Zixiibacteriota bacterium]|nr:MAG: M48 family metalloprotease [candidate division Zixibacteria bacterium]
MTVFSVLVFVSIILAGCATTGPGGKQSLILIGSATEVSIGESMDQEIRAKNQILQDSSWQGYMDEISGRIVSRCDRRDIEYHFAIIKSDQVNAFATPGGYVYLYTGLLKTMDNEAELAAVMAHEISHVVARHGIKRLQAAMGVALLQELLLGESPEALNTVVNVGLGLTFAEYSRENEREADTYGMQYMMAAGYHPDAAITMFEKLASMSDGSPGFFERLSMSHPQTQERIANAKALIASLKPLPPGLELKTTRYQLMKSRLPQ